MYNFAIYNYDTMTAVTYRALNEDLFTGELHKFEQVEIPDPNDMFQHPTIKLVIDPEVLSTRVVSLIDVLNAYLRTNEFAELID